MSKIIKLLDDRVKFMEKVNDYSPFPLYDTEYIKDVIKIIKKLESNNKYDELPVVACKYCQSLHILNDELENDICVSCGSVNDIKVYNNIKEYMESKEGNDERE